MIARYRKIRRIYFVLLVVAISFMSVGFASFSEELVISSNAIVNPDYGDFRIVFSSSSTDSSDTSDILGTVYEGDSSEVKTGYATIDNEGSSPTISGLTATFTEPGQTVVYEFYVHNVGAYVAYLKDITFNNVSGHDSNKVCTSMDGGSVSSDICSGIAVALRFGDGEFINSTITGISGTSLERNGVQKISVYIEYSGGASDNDFTVEFGDITATFSTVDN